MDFRIRGLDPDCFSHLYGLSDEELRQSNVVRYTADRSFGFPDRIELRDVNPGENVLLLNYEHLALQSPYRSSHAIFVREGAEKAFDEINTVPTVMHLRKLSIRGFDKDGMMLAASLIDGVHAHDEIVQFLEDDKIAFLHVHNAVRGCYSGVVERA